MIFNINKAIGRVRALVDKGRFPQALKECNDFLRSDSSNLELILLKAMILGSPLPEVSDASLAIATLEQALEQHPGEPRLRVALGQACEAAGDYEAAARWYEAALKLDANNGMTLYALACLFEAPEVDMSIATAIRYLEAAVELMPQNWQIRRDLAKLLWRERQLGQAATEYRRALRTEPPPDEYSRRQILGWLRQIRRGKSFERGYQSILET